MKNRTTIVSALLFVLSISVQAATYNYTASTDLIFNPERGLYIHSALESGQNFANIRAGGYSLCYANLLLDSFRTSNIDAARLQEIEDAFDAIRVAGLKGILRITYDNTSAGTDTTLAWMETHLQQLQPVFEDNSDVIAFVQAGVIGGKMVALMRDENASPGREGKQRLGSLKK